MPRIGLINCLIGFLAVFIAAAGGLFLSFDATRAFLHDKSVLSSWVYQLMSSAHGHTNLFGLLHIALGLTLPYTRLPSSLKWAETIGLALGTIAMSVLMLVRAYQG